MSSIKSRGRGRGRGGRTHKPLPESQINEGDLNILDPANINENSEQSIHFNDKCTQFEDLIPDSYKLKNDAIQAIYMKGTINHPSKIQTQAIPYLLDEIPKSIIAQAATGGGKTLAFILPMYLRVDPENPKLQAICVCPTRELIRQAYEWMKDVSALNPITIAELMRSQDDEAKGGQEEAKEGQEEAKEGHEEAKSGQGPKEDQKPPQVIIGTPSQISNLPDEMLRSVKICVFDEADNLFNSDRHKPFAAKIIKRIPETSQVAFFSATYPKPIKLYIMNHVNRKLIPITIQRKEQIQLINNVFTRCERNEVDALLIKALKNIQISSAFIFVSKKVETEKYRDLLIKNGFTATILTADLPSSQRDQNLRDFKEGKAQFLVTVNIFGRGIDIPSATHVFNISLPVPETVSITVNGQKVSRRFTDVDSYVHRAGRAGRFGKTGFAFTFVTSDRDFKSICLISRMLSAEFIQIKKEQIDNIDGGEELDAKVVAEQTNDVTEKEIEQGLQQIEQQTEETATEQPQQAEETATEQPQPAE